MKAVPNKHVFWSRIPWQIDDLISAPRSLLGVLAVLALLYSILPLTVVRLPNGIEILFAVLGLFTLFYYGRGLRWGIPVKLMAASVIVLTLSWVFMLFDHPDLARSGPSLEDFLDKFFFLFIALALGGRARNALLYVALVGIFIIAMPWLSGNGFGELIRGFQGHRAEFGINPIRSGMLFGVVFLGLCCFAGKLFLRGEFSAFRFALWLVLVVYALSMIVITQSRTAMVALIPASLVAVVYFFAAVQLPGRKKKTIAIGFFGLLLLMGFSGYQMGMSDLVADRFEQESVVVSKLMDGEMENIPKTSWGLRFHFLKEGSEGFMERPWTGWGYRAGEIVLNQEGLLRSDGDAYSQVHNAYLEAALRYGIGGVVIILALFAWVFHGLWKVRREGLIEADMFGFLVVSLVFFMATNLFDGMLFQTEGVLLFNMLMGVAASFIFRRSLNYQRVEANES